METVQDLIAKIYKAVELKNVESSALFCMRVARRINDHLNSIVFMRCLYKNAQQGFWYLAGDVKDLSKEAREFLWNRSR